MAVSQNGGRARGKMSTRPICSNWRRSTSAAPAIELRLHQVRHQMDDVRFEAPVQKAAGRFESQQSSADDRRAARRSPRSA